MCGESRKESLDLKKHLDDMLIQENLQDYEIVDADGGMASARVLSRLVFDNILLIGDAAGLTSPLHGGGIDMACLSSVLAVTSRNNAIRAAITLRHPNLLLATYKWPRNKKNLLNGLCKKITNTLRKTDHRKSQSSWHVMQ